MTPRREYDLLEYAKLQKESNTILSLISIFGAIICLFFWAYGTVVLTSNLFKGNYGAVQALSPAIVGAFCLSATLFWSFYTSGKSGATRLCIDNEGATFFYPSGRTYRMAWSDRRAFLQISFGQRLNQTGAQKYQEWQTCGTVTPRLFSPLTRLTTEAEVALEDAARTHGFDVVKFTTPWHLDIFAGTPYTYVHIYGPEVRRRHKPTPEVPVKPFIDTGQG